MPCSVLVFLAQGLVGRVDQLERISLARWASVSDAPDELSGSPGDRQVALAHGLGIGSRRYSQHGVMVVEVKLEPDP